MLKLSQEAASARFFFFFYRWFRGYTCPKSFQSENTESSLFVEKNTSSIIELLIFRFLNREIFTNFSFISSSVRIKWKTDRANGIRVEIKKIFGSGLKSNPTHPSVRIKENFRLSNNVIPSHIRLCKFNEKIHQRMRLVNCTKLFVKVHARSCIRWTLRRVVEQSTILFYLTIQAE